MKLHQALVREPSPHLADGLLTHLEPSDVDVNLARRQWDDYCAILRDHTEVIEVPPAPQCPDSVFIEDPVFTYGNTAIITRLKYPSRQPEHEAVRGVVRDLGFDVVDELPAGAILEGGDILKFNDTVWVGLSTRTNQAGVDALREILAPQGAEVIGVTVEHALHLKSAITALPDGSFLAHPDYVPDEAFFPGFRRAPEFLGSQIIMLGGNKILMSDSGPQTAQMLRADGFDVVTTPMTEFEKTEGCVTCLSVRIRR